MKGTGFSPYIVNRNEGGLEPLREGDFFGDDVHSFGG
jgi:hypothetical protein